MGALSCLAVSTQPPLSTTVLYSLLDIRSQESKIQPKLHRKPPVSLLLAAHPGSAGRFITLT